MDTTKRSITVSDTNAVMTSVDLPLTSFCLTTMLALYLSIFIIACIVKPLFCVFFCGYFQKKMAEKCKQEENEMIEKHMTYPDESMIEMIRKNMMDENNYDDEDDQKHDIEDLDEIDELLDRNVSHQL